MKKKITVLTLCALLFAICRPVEVQQSMKVARLGFLDSSTASGSAVLVDMFRQEICNRLNALPPSYFAENSDRAT